MSNLQPIRRRAQDWFSLVKRAAARDHQDALLYLNPNRRKSPRLLQRLIGGKSR